MQVPLRSALSLTALVSAGPCCFADSNVVVSSFADPAYTKQKYNGEKPRVETYVVMQGQYFESETVDHSVERMPFRGIMDFFAPELARREYWPARSPGEADLLIVVHWGTTMRMATSDEMRARDAPITDMRESANVITRTTLQAQADNPSNPNPQLGLFLATWDPIEQQFMLDNHEADTERLRTAFNTATNAQLLGYTGQLRRLANTTNIDPLELTLKSDLATERYFVILKAYDLHEKVPPGKPRHAVWVLHLNMRSPGTNFRIALDRMSATATNYFGRASDGILTLPSHVREGKVEVGAPVIVSEKKK